MGLKKYVKIGFWGALLGTVAGLFLAKKSGKELYQDVKNTGDELKNKADQAVNKVSEKAKETFTELKEEWSEEKRKNIGQ